MFEEYLSPGAREDNFVGRDRRVSLRAGPRHLHDFTGGPIEQTKNPLDVAIDGNAFLAVQTPGGERYTRDGGLQINAQGQLVTAVGRTGARHQRPDRVPADRPRHQHLAGRHRHGARRHQPHRLDARQAAHGAASPSRSGC